MAYDQYGDSNYRFGIDDSDATAIKSAVGLEPTSWKLDLAREFDEKATDRNGEVQSRALGPFMRTLTFSGTITNRALFEAADATFSFEGEFYMVTNTNITAEGGKFEQGEVTADHYSNISS